MRDKKKSQREKTPEQEALEKHVDAMMDPKQPDEPAEQAAPDVPEANVEDKVLQAVLAPADSGSSPTTAPTLSSKKTGKKIAISDAAAEPLSIDNLDEQIKSITEGETGKKSKKASKAKAKKEPEASAEASEPSETAEKEEPADEAEPQEDIADQGMDLDDAETDKAVDDIVAYEGDVVLAVADSTAAEHNRQAMVPESKGHPILGTAFWVLVSLAAIVIIGLVALLIMGDSLADKLGL